VTGRYEMAERAIDPFLNFVEERMSTIYINSYQYASPVLRNNLMAFWSLEEASGNRADAHGSNTLADNNTVTSNTGKVGTAAQFTATNSEYLSIADNAALSMGDIDFTIAGWVYLDTKANEVIAAKYRTNTNNREYLLYYALSDGATNRFIFLVSPNGVGTTAVVANNFGEPSTGTWYFVVAWHDATANTINIQINNGTANSTAHSTGVFDGTDDFKIGALHTTSPIYFWNGRIDQLGIWKRVLTATEKAWLYNSGNGRSYAEVAANTG